MYFLRIMDERMDSDENSDSSREDGERIFQPIPLPINETYKSKEDFIKYKTPPHQYRSTMKVIRQAREVVREDGIRKPYYKKKKKAMIRFKTHNERKKLRSVEIDIEEAEEEKTEIEKEKEKLQEIKRKGLKKMKEQRKQFLENMKLQFEVENQKIIKKDKKLKSLRKKENNIKEKIYHKELVWKTANIFKKMERNDRDSSSSDDEATIFDEDTQEIKEIMWERTKNIEKKIEEAEEENKEEIYIEEEEVTDGTNVEEQNEETDDIEKIQSPKQNGFKKAIHKHIRTKTGVVVNIKRLNPEMVKGFLNKAQECTKERKGEIESDDEVAINLDKNDGFSDSEQEPESEPEPKPEQRLEPEPQKPKKRKRNSEEKMEEYKKESKALCIEIRNKKKGVEEKEEKTPERRIINRQDLDESEEEGEIKNEEKRSNEQEKDEIKKRYVGYVDIKEEPMNEEERQRFKEGKKYPIRIKGIGMRLMKKNFFKNMKELFDDNKTYTKQFFFHKKEERSQTKYGYRKFEREMDENIGKYTYPCDTMTIKDTTYLIFKQNEKKRPIPKTRNFNYATNPNRSVIKRKENMTDLAKKYNNDNHFIEEVGGLAMKENPLERTNHIIEIMWLFIQQGHRRNFEIYDSLTSEETKNWTGVLDYFHVRSAETIMKEPGSIHGEGLVMWRRMIESHQKQKEETTNHWYHDQKGRNENREEK